ncbi:MAG: DUF433 domain-containing protein [Deltaproteobacteria bacterium]|nr:DUF433 domain-containing protein [Deltaproteobacteria bacterium]
MLWRVSSRNTEAGEKIEDIEENYRLTRDQIMAALAYATVEREVL